MTSVLLFISVLVLSLFCPAIGALGIFRRRKTTVR
jgi:hypothetical protein